MSSELLSELYKKSLSNASEGHTDNPDELLNELPCESPKGGEAITLNAQEEVTIKELTKKLGITRQAVQQREKDGKLKNLGWELVKGTGTSRTNPKRYRKIKTEPLKNNSSSWDTKVNSFLKEVTRNEQP